jgi:hypothetical protein
MLANELSLERLTAFSTMYVCLDVGTAHRCDADKTIHVKTIRWFRARTTHRLNPQRSFGGGHRLPPSEGLII